MAAETPNVFIFPRNEPGTTGHLDLVEPLRAFPGGLRDALAGISDADASTRATSSMTMHAATESAP